MDVRALIEQFKDSPQVQQAVDAVEAQLGNAPIMPQDLDEIIQMLESVVQNPEMYPQVLDAAIKDGVISEGEAPAQYDPIFVISLLLALYNLKDRMTTSKFARGGLAQAARMVASAGRGGDTMLAHINPREAEMLRRMGGAGTVNPNTGLREYKGLSSILRAVAPIALSFIAPGLGTAIGSAIGLSGTTAAIAGNALLNAGTSALTGGDPLRGAIMGGLTGGLGNVVGGAANNFLGAGLGQTAQNALGSGIVGGIGGALTGQGFLRGAAQGALGSYAGSKFGELGSGAVGAGTRAGGQTFGNMMAAGYKPKEALVGGALSGLATGLMSAKANANDRSGLKMKPSDAVVEGLKPNVSNDSVVGDPAAQYSLSKIPDYSGNVNVDYSLTGQTPAQLTLGQSSTPLDGSVLAPQPPAGFDLTSKIMNASPMQLLSGASMLSSLSNDQKKQVQEKLSPEQQEYFNRPSVVWDWDTLQKDAAASNVDLGTYVAQNWGQITGGKYNKPAMAQGGMMSPLARFAQGAGSGRADTIDAKLSDGEYVIDAETVAMLGDGSSKEGAKRLEQMRQQIRKHKGKTMAKGKFSPNAKSPLAYMKGAV